MEERSAELLRAQIQIREEAARHENEKKQWEVSKKNENVKRKLRHEDTADSPPIGARKRRHVRQLGSDPEDTADHSGMEWQAERWENSRRQRPRQKGNGNQRTSEESRTDAKGRKEQDMVIGRKE